jgi:Zn-dependent peptidase ImmA (M78 family)/transcriptional regulator with XRE-family HTH domain
MKVTLNSDMVLLAREYRRLTQGELVKRMRISQGTLSKIESGALRDIDESVMLALEEELGFPSQFFQQEERACGIGSSAYFYRKKAKLSAGDRKWIHSAINIMRLHIKKLLAGVEMNSDLRIPRLEISEYGSASAIANAVRCFWNLPDGPIRNLTVLMENAGVIIFPCYFGTDAMDATSVWLSDAPPLVFINEAIPGDRWRFTLAHELAHLVMHEVPSETQEDEADEFASEFLMPRRDIGPDLSGRLSLKRFAVLKPNWKVAISALIRRARDLGKITETQYKYYMMNMAKMGYLKNEPVPIQREEPLSVRKLMRLYLDEFGYSKSDLASILNLKSPDDISFLYGIDSSGGPRLRIVT